MKADVIVVGAGPAGSLAARTLAERGFSVICVERKQEIGPPKRCAEGLNKDTMEALGINPDPAWALNRVHGGVIYSPKGKEIKIQIDKTDGYVIERKIFEKHLAADAIRKGAKYIVKANAESVIQKNGVVSGVSVNHMGENLKIQSKIVIAADGVDSKIARSAGINSTNKLHDFHAGIQYEMAGVSCKEDLLHFFFGDHIAPKGYAWIFPKGNTIANVGLGIMGSSAKEGARAINYLDKFISSNPKYFGNASYLEINAGGIPVSAGIEEIVGEGIMLVGDAAHHVHPVTGGGMAFALHGGQLAGNVAADAIEASDYSKKYLSAYKVEWDKTHGAKLKKLYRARMFLEKLSEDDMEKLANILTPDDILRLTGGDTKFVIALLLKKAPSLIPILKKIM